MHVAFSLDTCDREAIRYVASTRGVDGALVRGLRVERVEARFGPSARVPMPVQWLSDNDPCFVAGETVAFGRRLGLDICTTPA